VSWSPAQRRLHWGIAALVLATAIVGLVMVAVPFRALLAKFVLYQVHKTLGLVVLGLAAAQVVLHFRRGRPPPEPSLPAWQHRAALAAHGLLFLLLGLVPLSGWLAASAAPAAIPTLLFGIVPVPHAAAPNEALYAVLRPLHVALVVMLALLAAGHAGAAALHHRRGRPVLVRMWRG